VLKIASNAFFNGYAYHKNAIIKLDTSGTVLDIDLSGVIREEANMLFYSGIIIPGIIYGANDGPEDKTSQDVDFDIIQSKHSENTTALRLIYEKGYVAVLNQHRHVPDLFTVWKKMAATMPFLTFIQSQTLDMAKKTGLCADLGSIEKGKRPGINLLYPFDFKNLSPVNSTKLKRLL